jgi:hypothetical protein
MRIEPRVKPDECSQRGAAAGVTSVATMQHNGARRVCPSSGLAVRPHHTGDSTALTLSALNGRCCLWKRPVATHINACKGEWDRHMTSAAPTDHLSFSTSFSSLDVFIAKLPSVMYRSGSAAMASAPKLSPLPTLSFAGRATHAFLNLDDESL